MALTGVAEPALRTRLSASPARLPQPTEAGVGPSGSAASVPAQALAQRPDLLSAERALVAAAADVTQSDAQRFPRIALSGNIGAARSSAAGFTSSGTVWSLGPLQLSLPLFDGGSPPRQCRGRPGPLRRGGRQLPRPPAHRGARGRRGAGAPAVGRRPRGRCVDRGRGL